LTPLLETPFVIISFSPPLCCFFRFPPFGPLRPLERGYPPSVANCTKPIPSSARTQRLRAAFKRLPLPIRVLPDCTNSNMDGSSLVPASHLLYFLRFPTPLSGPPRPLRGRDPGTRTIQASFLPLLLFFPGCLPRRLSTKLQFQLEPETVSTTYSSASCRLFFCAGPYCCSFKTHVSSPPLVCFLVCCTPFLSKSFANLFFPLPPSPFLSTSPNQIPNPCRNFNRLPSTPAPPR